MEKAIKESKEKLGEKMQELAQEVARCEGCMLLCLSSHPEGIGITRIWHGVLRPQLVSEFAHESRRLVSRTVLNEMEQLAKIVQLNEEPLTEGDL